MNEWVVLKKTRKDFKYKFLTQDVRFEPLLYIFIIFVLNWHIIYMHFRLINDEIDFSISKQFTYINLVYFSSIVIKSKQNKVEVK